MVQDTYIVQSVIIFLVFLHSVAGALYSKRGGLVDKPSFGCKQSSRGDFSQDPGKLDWNNNAFCVPTEQS